MVWLVRFVAAIAFLVSLKILIFEDEEFAVVGLALLLLVTAMLIEHRLFKKKE